MTCQRDTQEMGPKPKSPYAWALLRRSRGSSGSSRHFQRSASSRRMRVIRSGTGSVPLVNRTNSGVGLGIRHVTLPEAGCGVDLLDDVDPEARGVCETEAALAERLVGELKTNRTASMLELGKGGGSVFNLDFEADAG